MLHVKCPSCFCYNSNSIKKKKNRLTDSRHWVNCKALESIDGCSIQRVRVSETWSGYLFKFYFEFVNKWWLEMQTRYICKKKVVCSSKMYRMPSACVHFWVSHLVDISTWYSHAVMDYLINVSNVLQLVTCCLIELSSKFCSNVCWLKCCKEIIYINIFAI